MTRIAHVLDEAIAEALETMAFMAVLPPEDEAPPCNCLLVTMQFSGRQSGRIEILAPMEFCRVLAQNIAAMDDVDEAVCADALKEFCNVACGLVLPRLAESAVDVFDVTVPSIRPSRETPVWRQFCALPGATVFNVDGFSIAARLVRAARRA